VYGASEFQSILLQASVAFSTSVKKQKKKLSYATHLHFHLHNNHKQLRRHAKRKWHKLICINKSVRYFSAPTDGDRATGNNSSSSSSSSSSSCVERNLNQTANRIKFFLPGSWGRLYTGYIQNVKFFPCLIINSVINPLNAELNPICYLLALLELTIFSTLTG